MLLRGLNVVRRNALADLQRNLSDISINKDANDEIGWNLEKKCGFIVKSVYDSLIQDTLDHDSTNIFKYIWDHKFPPKVSFFLWTIAHSILPTRDMLLRRGMEVPQT